MVALAVTVSACSSANNPAAPAPTPIVTLSGTVIATNGGQPLVGAAIDVAGQHTVTDATGHYSFDVPGGLAQLMISGPGLLPRVVRFNTYTIRTPALDAISESNGFDLGFYRQFVRNGFEHPENLSPLARWITDPVFDVQTVDETGATIDPALLDRVRASIALMVPIWSNGQRQAVFGHGVPVRFVAALIDYCGASLVGPSPLGAIELRYRVPRCDIGGVVVRHEVGHLMGFWHTDNPADLMHAPALVALPSARERYHAAIAYSRPVGNRDPDTDVP